MMQLKKTGVHTKSFISFVFLDCDELGFLYLMLADFIADLHRNQVASVKRVIILSLTKMRILTHHQTRYGNISWIITKGSNKPWDMWMKKTLREQMQKNGRKRLKRNSLRQTRNLKCQDMLNM